MKTDTFVDKYDRAVAASNRVALAVGYGEPVTEQMRLDVAVAWRGAVAEFETVARELASAIARASVFMPEAGSMAERVDVLKRGIEKTKTEDIRRARVAEDARFTGRA